MRPTAKRVNIGSLLETGFILSSYCNYNIIYPTRQTTSIWCWLARTMKGLRSVAQRIHSRSRLIQSSVTAARKQRLAKVGKQLQLPTDKQLLREVLDRAAAEYYAARPSLPPP